ncbi:MAG: bifunctional riboflavin kinase/FAD synthetase [Deltaproteobacteria bacterium]|nr:bifunctional riboflavin kinase/FAD synthetase [Deltaproteobacteria bacterium]
MDVIRGIQDIPAGLRNAVVTIGNFDGVHLGHQRLLKRLREDARQENLKTVVITFDPHPKMILRPEVRPFYLIATLEEKIALLSDTGIDAVIIISFTREYAQKTAEEFVRQALWDGLHIHKIVIGHDYTFGKDKEGNEAFLASFGKKLGFGVDVINAVGVGDTVISSTAIREAILGGNVKKAAALLGRPYNISGPVVHGKHRGTGLGFPTANIRPEKVLIPAGGIYAVIACVRGKRYPGVANIGINPTFDNGALSVEVHLLDFRENIYGEKLDILFIDRIRDEIKFPGPSELALQIAQDIEQAREILKLHF